MDPLRLGFRSIVGITMPGTILVLSVLYGLWAIDALPQSDGGSIHAAFYGIGFLLVSYALGSILSLRASGRTDRLSARLIPRENRPEGGLTLEGVKKRLEGFSGGDAAWRWFSTAKESQAPMPPADDGMPLHPGQCRNLWAFDEFPYPCWSLVRLGLCCPKKVFIFYWQFHRQILAQLYHSPHFFNYCKMAVYSGNGAVPSPLAAEIQEAESNFRFLAGAFDALVISSAILVGMVLHLYFGLYFGAQSPLWVLLPVVAVGALVVVPPGATKKETAPIPTEVSTPGNPFYRALKDCVVWLFGAIRRFSRSRQCVLYAFRAVGLLAFLCLILSQFPVPSGTHATAHQAGRSLSSAQPKSLGLIAMAIAEYCLAWAIVSQGLLRRRRHAEVAAVMDAFFLTCCGKDGANEPSSDEEENNEPRGAPARWIRWWH